MDKVGAAGLFDQQICVAMYTPLNTKKAAAFILNNIFYIAARVHAGLAAAVVVLLQTVAAISDQRVVLELQNKCALDAIKSWLHCADDSHNSKKKSF